MLEEGGRREAENRKKYEELYKRSKTLEKANQNLYDMNNVSEWENTNCPKMRSMRSAIFPTLKQNVDKPFIRHQTKKLRFVLCVCRLLASDQPKVGISTTMT